jgi:ketosteroid isomerase-like protein
MSQENVETAREAIDAWDRGERAAWLALHDPDYEVCSHPLVSALTRDPGR